MDHRKQIQEFFAGNLTEKQANELLEWLHSAEGEEFLAAEVDQIWSEKIKEISYKELETDTLWQKIKDSKYSYPKPQLASSEIKPKKAVPLWFKVACSFILFFSAILVILVVRNTNGNTDLSSDESSSMVIKYNPPGQKTKVHLPDGSVVYLNSDSKIEYPVDFLVNRRIALEGEAFFTVSKDAINAFKVITQGITTTALGTSFNISSFPNNEKVQVSLITGKVVLNKDGIDDDMILNPGEESVLSDTEKKFTKRKVDVSKSILWIDGILTFENTPFSKVIEILERWYGVKIEMNGKTNHSLCSGTFQNNEMLSNVLDVLGSSVGFEYTINGKSIKINLE